LDCKLIAFGAPVVEEIAGTTLALVSITW